MTKKKFLFSSLNGIILFDSLLYSLSEWLMSIIYFIQHCNTNNSYEQASEKERDML